MLKFKNKIVSFIIEIILFYFYVVYIMKPKNRMVWLFILLVVIIFLGVSMGTYESFAPARVAAGTAVYRNNNNNMNESFLPRRAAAATAVYNNNNTM